jgi:P-type Mg2+ transporter
MIAVIIWALLYIAGCLLVIMVIGIIIPFSPFGTSIGLEPLPLSYFPWLVGILLSYCVLTQMIKNWYIKRFVKWL